MKICLACRKSFVADDFCCPVCGHSPELLDGYLAFAPDLAVGYDGFKTDSFSLLAELEEGNFWFESRNRLLIWALGKYLPDTETFFEIGCGTGFVLSGIQRKFQDIKLFGSDIFTEGFAYAKERVPGATFFQMDARNIPFENEFDVIGAFDVLEHIGDDKCVLSHVHAALKPQGFMLLTVPQHTWLWSPVDEYGRHVRRYAASDLHQKIETAGFRIIRSTSFVTTLLPVMIASRIFQKKVSDATFDAKAELKISPWLNSLFTKLLSTEISFIKKGFCFPAGGSRLVVARKK